VAQTESLVLSFLLIFYTVVWGVTLPHCVVSDFPNFTFTISHQSTTPLSNNSNPNP